MKAKTSTHFITRLIHWCMAVLIIFIVILGFYMVNFESYGLYPLHKSFGIVALVAIIFRLGWRVAHPWQSSVEGAKSEKLVKRAHLILIILLALMPITGICFSGFGGYGVSVFGASLIPSQHDEAGVAIPFNVFLSDFGYAAHEVVAYLFTALLIVHVLAALKHHIIDKDNTLKRMLGRFG